MAVVRLRGRRVIWILGLWALLVLMYVITSNRLLDVRDRVILRNYVSRGVDNGRLIKFSPGHIACQRPSLPVNSTDVLRFFHVVDSIRCDDEKDWVTVRGSVAKIQRAAIKIHGHIECSFRAILRGEDDVSVTLDEELKSSTTFTFRSSDFYSVSCTAADGARWAAPLAGIREIDTLSRNSWSDAPEDSMKTSVLMLGIDSLSHNTFIRTLPKTYKFLTETLNADILDGYNVVGDGTTQALVPMLSGKTELELPETRKRVGSSAQFVDIYPLIWKDFAEAGYATLYAEDMPYQSTFNYRLKGFKDPPTHHYMRPFYLHLYKELSSHPNLCVRSRPRHKVFLDYLYNFLLKYKTQPVFGFSLHGELSHDDVNLVSVADDDLVDFLQRLKSEGLLDNTLLMVYADHGHRFQEIRSTQQGKQEERLPFVSLVVPEKIKQSYASAYQNLKANTQRLVTPFDIHASLKDVLHYTGAKLGQTTSRSISLFSQIPSSRTCSEAFIEPHWCACLTWEPLPVTDERVRQASTSLVHYINTHTAPHRGLCQELSLDKITWAAILLPTEGLMSFKQNADMDGFVPNLNAQTPVTEEVYEVHISTVPGDAQYEASLTYSIRKDTFSVRLSDISRTNKYGNTSKCILNVESELVKYCVCRGTDIQE